MAKFACHGELTLLPQWVSATSALRGLGRFNSPRQDLLAMAKSDFPKP